MPSLSCDCVELGLSVWSLPAVYVHIGRFFSRTRPNSKTGVCGKSFSNYLSQALTDVIDSPATQAVDTHHSRLILSNTTTNIDEQQCDLYHQCARAI